MAGWFSRLFASRVATPDAIPNSIASSVAATIPSSPEDVFVPSPVQSPIPHEQSENQFLKKNAGLTWRQKDDLNAHFLDWLFDSHDKFDLVVNKTEQDILLALEKIVNSRQSGADQVRRMPGVVPQLLQSLRTEDFSGTELARQISHDVVLVEGVIRLANSSLYRSTETITSIEHAVLVLGQTGLRQLITSVAFKPIIDLKSGHFTKMLAPKIWEHSEQCAIASRVLAEGTTVESFECFLAGLMQHVGLIVALRIIDQLSDDNHRIGSINFCNALISHGRKLSVGITRAWNFPASVAQAIEEQQINSRKTALSALGSILEMGDYLSKIQILSRYNRLRADDPAMRKGLSSQAIEYMNDMDESTKSTTFPPR